MKARMEEILIFICLWTVVFVLPLIIVIMLEQTARRITGAARDWKKTWLPVLMALTGSAIFALSAYLLVNGLYVSFGSRLTLYYLILFVAGIAFIAFTSKAHVLSAIYLIGTLLHIIVLRIILQDDVKFMRDLFSSGGGEARSFIKFTAIHVLPTLIPFCLAIAGEMLFRNRKERRLKILTKCE